MENWVQTLLLILKKKSYFFVIKLFFLKKKGVGDFQPKVKPYPVHSL